MTRLSEKIFRRDGAPSAGGIELPVGQRFILPAVANGINNAPCGFDLVAPDEKCRVPSHRLEQKPLISFRGISAKFCVVAKVHPDGPHLQTCPGNFTVESKIDSFI